jgi:hypothetical protein
VNTRRFVSLIALVCVTAMAVAETPDDPRDDPVVKRKLISMNNASTWFHPDLFGEFSAMRYYSNRDYRDARKYFEYGALYADKFSQLSLGLMYINGEGGQKDPVTGEAWLEVAAERNYPAFVATRDRFKSTLSPEQLKHAQQLRDELMVRYGDAIAKRRMTTQLQLGNMQITGSRLGAFGNIMHFSAKQGCSGTANFDGQSVPEAGCGGDGIYADSRWKPDLYFASRDAQWKATVTVGAITPDVKPAPSKTSTADPNDRQ